MATLRAARLLRSRTGAIAAALFLCFLTFAAWGISGSHFAEVLVVSGAAQRRPSVLEEDHVNAIPLQSSATAFARTLVAAKETGVASTQNEEILGDKEHRRQLHLSGVVRPARGGDLAKTQLHIWARVAGKPWALPYEEGLAWQPPDVISIDSDGSLQHTLEVPQGEVQICVSADSASAWTRHDLILARSSQEEISGLEVIIGSANELIRGRVEDVNATHVAGALVRDIKNGTECKSDAYGHFELPVDLSTTKRTIACWKEGQGSAIQEVQGSDSVTLRLQPDRLISGTILGSRGDRLNDARVTIASSIRRRSITSPDGRFQVGAPANEGFRIVATKSQYVDGIRRVSFGAGPVDMDITMRRSVILRGRCRNAINAPIPYASVVLYALDPGERSKAMGQPYSVKHVTNMNGELRAANIPEGKIWAIWTADGYARQRFEINVQASINGESTGHVWILDSEERVHGRIVDVSGHGLSGARVVARHIVASESWAHAISETVSGSNGLFELMGIPRQRIELIVTKQGYGLLRKNVTVSGSRLPDDLVMTPGGMISGLVSDKISKLPIKEFSVYFVPIRGGGGFPSKWLRGLKFKEDNGAFNIPQRDLGGTYAMRVEARGYREGSLQQIEVAGGAATHIEWELEPK